MMFFFSNQETSSTKVAGNGTEATGVFSCPGEERNGSGLAMAVSPLNNSAALICFSSEMIRCLRLGSLGRARWPENVLL